MPNLDSGCLQRRKGGIMFILCGVAFPSYGAVLLDCKLEGGYPDVEIYIDEEEGYVLYNAQYLNSYERMRTYQGETGPIAIDEGLDITDNNNAFLTAHDENSSFVFVKREAKFAYAWTTPYPLENGGVAAFGNSTQGECSANPFSQPVK